MQCPACQSDNIRRLSAVWEEGTYTEKSTATTTTRGRSNVYGGGQMGVAFVTGKGTTRTTTQGMSTLAKRVARPSAETPLRDAIVMLGWGTVVIFVVGVILGVAVSDPFAFVVMAAMAAFLLYRVGSATRRGFHFNGNELPGLLQRWERSWWCSKCGDVFEQAT